MRNDHRMQMDTGKGIQEEEPVPGYLTVYLVLVMTVLLSLCLTLIEGARGSAIRLETEIVMATASDSILAEYHRELMRQFNLFAIDSSYGTANSGSRYAAGRLKSYLDRNLETEELLLSGLLYRDFLGMSAESAEFTRVRFLTDENGAVFRRRAVEAIRDDIGLTLMEQVAEWASTIEENSIEDIDVAGQMSAAEAKIEKDRNRIFEWERIGGEAEESGGQQGAGGGQQGAGGGQQEAGEGRLGADGSGESGEMQLVDKTPDYSSPVSAVERNVRKGILTVVLDDPDSLSTRGVHSEVLVYQRMKDGNVNFGNWSLEEAEPWEEATEKLLFDEYLLRYFGRYGAVSEEDALLYQAEYLIAGRDSDVENLRNVAERLLALRTAADFLYIQGDGEKTAEAAVLGTAVALLILSPELADTIKELILLGWSYMEGIYDVRTLLAGGRVPLMKSPETWHYSLTGALGGNADTGGEDGSGLSYKDYLRIFLFLADQDDLTGRAMNLVEADLRLTAGNGAFRLDACIDAFEAEAVIASVYGYRLTIRRQRRYE